ncbi:MAG: substrate-binding domain-containing protein [Candidatus Sumerlaeota bacterium]|nr:substrate-binding domain-containing protein [Candidatus Sumerlaeota bacterium]
MGKSERSDNPRPGRRLAAKGPARVRVAAFSRVDKNVPLWSLSQQACLGVLRYARGRPTWEVLVNDPRFEGTIDLVDREELHRLGVAGLIVLSTVPEREADALVALRLPMVFTFQHRFVSRFPTVIPDDAQVGRLAALHLLQQGFRHLAFCLPPGLERFSTAGDDSIRWALLRQEGFLTTGARAGSQCHALPIGEDEAAGAALTRRGQHVQGLARQLASLPRPAGVFAPADEWALVVERACQQAGLKVPDDIGIVGANNDDLVCRSSSPPLTSVDLDAERIGFEAAAALDRFLRAGSWDARPVVVPPKGVAVRTSSDTLLAIEDEAVRGALRYIRQRFAEPIAAQDVARAVRRSSEHLCRRFHERLGFTIHEEIRRLRIERAKELLEGASLSLKEIAAVSGLGDPVHFSHAFASVVGVPPGRWRREHGGGEP